jgi:hypothetical protein
LLRSIIASGIDLNPILPFLSPIVSVLAAIVAVIAARSARLQKRTRLPSLNTKGNSMPNESSQVQPVANLPGDQKQEHTTDAQAKTSTTSVLNSRKSRLYIVIIAALLSPVLGVVAWYAIAVFFETPLTSNTLDFEGTYAKDVPPEWMISFTATPAAGSELSPPTDNANKEVPVPAGSHDVLSRGLGAPLWVLLFAVLGSALFTVVLLVKEIESPRDYSQDYPDPTQTRTREIVLHQLYILFAPLSGVFLYQILVLADAVTQPVTVAIAALGAGAWFLALL